MASKLPTSTSYAAWNYLALPFLLTAPGIKVVEVEAWPGSGAGTSRRGVIASQPLPALNSQR